MLSIWEALGIIPSTKTVTKMMLVIARLWRHTPLIPVLRRLRQVDRFESEASLVYIARSRQGGAT